MDIIESRSHRRRHRQQAGLEVFQCIAIVAVAGLMGIKMAEYMRDRELLPGQQGQDAQQQQSFLPASMHD